VTVFGDRAFKEVMKVKMKSKGWDLNLIGLVSLHEKEDTRGLSPYNRGKNMWDKVRDSLL